MAGKIESIEVTYREGAVQSRRSFNQYGNNHLEDFLNFLIELDIYSDIVVSKNFSTSKAVMKRLTS